MLDSWNEGATKTAILEFIRSVTTPGDTFVPPADRIATFDNDGTLWCEKPRYVQAEFLLRGRNRDSDGAAPELGAAHRRPGGQKLSGLLESVPALVDGVADAFRGITTDAFEDIVRTFFDTATHPTMGRPFTQLTYRPMLELIEVLESHDFHVYICSGGGRDFIRVVAEEMYGIPRENVIGSAGTVEFRDGDLYRTKGIELPIDDGPGKPVHIWRRTGRKPLFAAGNANGDTEMLTIARFALLIDHDDAEREFAYQDGAEKVKLAAQLRGWTVASMKRDFGQVY